MATTRELGGTCLGLTIVKQLVKMKETPAFDREGLMSRLLGNETVSAKIIHLVLEKVPMAMAAMHIILVLENK